ncbi:MAG: tyrosine--tRNA ligase [Deltaproteobacteria bacterium]|nr:tyrosine--tRNA ligase [Deltaproteobacteria bacterium]
MTRNNIHVDEQLEILMHGTRFADEADDWDASETGALSLRAQMKEKLREKLKLGRPLRVYLGVDPTSTELHVGHFVPLQKLRKFQILSHQVIFLIGDYTATIGDPSQRAGARRRLSHEQVLKLAKTYTDQAFQVLDPEKTEVRYNGEWLAKISFARIIELASIFTMKQIINRRDFQQRMDSGESLRFHEALYTLMQGYDAYALECDVQVGGYDQHFNLLAGRNIQAYYGGQPHVMVTNPLLIGTDGRKMSKSFGNVINIKDPPFDMYGKTMRVSDEHIHDFLALTSSLPTREIDDLSQKLASGANPMEIKKRLSNNLDQQYHGDEAASKAEKKFRQVVQHKNAPDETPELEAPPDLLESTWVDLCFTLKMCESKSEVRRLMKQGGFYIEQEPMKNLGARVDIPAHGVLVRLGKRRYFRLIRGT